MQQTLVRMQESANRETTTSIDEIPGRSPSKTKVESTLSTLGFSTNSKSATSSKPQSAWHLPMTQFTPVSQGCSFYKPSNRLPNCVTLILPQQNCSRNASITSLLASQNFSFSRWWTLQYQINSKLPISLESLRNSTLNMNKVKQGFHLCYAMANRKPGILFGR